MYKILKIKYKGYTSYSSLHRKQNDSIFQNENGTFGLIRKICVIESICNSYVMIFYHELHADNNFIDNDDTCIEHLKYCNLETNNDLIVNYT